MVLMSGYYFLLMAGCWSEFQGHGKMHFLIQTSAELPYATAISPHLSV
jgi:hypothetical protein